MVDELLLIAESMIAHHGGAHLGKCAVGTEEPICFIVSLSVSVFLDHHLGLFLIDRENPLPEGHAHIGKALLQDPVSVG